MLSRTQKNSTIEMNSGVVGCRCVNFGVTWGCENRGCGYRYQITACECLIAGAVVGQPSVL